MGGSQAGRQAEAKKEVGRSVVSPDSEREPESDGAGSWKVLSTEFSEHGNGGKFLYGCQFNVRLTLFFIGTS